jgi:regulator of nucleoside diphosphate kinase
MHASTRAAFFAVEERMAQETRIAAQELPAIRMTRRDAGRLDALLADYPADAGGGAELLLRELLRAEVVATEEIAPGTVVMHSVVTYRDQTSDDTRTVRLVYPAERTSAPNALSVVAPLGAALIGLSEGQSISYRSIDGKIRTISVLRVHSHPAGESRGR